MIRAIAINTFRESIRSKVLYSVLVFAVILILISTFFGTVTVGDQVKVIKDFGLFSVSLFTVAFAVISGSSLLHKELARKTIYNILAKPVQRWQFLFGKYLGMLATTALMIGLMGSGLSVYVFLFEGKPDLLMLQAYLYVFLEIVIVCAAAIFFSAIVVTPLLIGLFTFGIFLAGRSVEYLLYFVHDGSVSGTLALILKTLNVALPNLSMLNVSNAVVYPETAALTVSKFLWSFIYAVSYAGILLILANLVFRRREFN